MGDGYAVVFSLDSFFSEMGRKGKVPKADIFVGAVKSVMQIFGAPCFSM